MNIKKMGAKVSSDKEADDPSTLVETLFSTFNTQIKKDVDMMLTILNDVGDADSLSKENELRLGQRCTNISKHVMNVQNQLVSYQGKLAGEKDSSSLVAGAEGVGGASQSLYTFGEKKLIRFISFFLNIEWTLSDIKKSKQPAWKRNIPIIIKKIRAFMLTEGNFTHILNQVQKKMDQDAKPLSFSPKFKPPEPTKKNQALQKVKELERKLQVVDKQLFDLS
jgi:hypothetical protein